MEHCQMNIREFAKVCGYSCATVSNAFSLPEKVKPGTLQHIRKLAEQYNFRPNRIAAATLQGNTKTIGIMVYANNSYFLQILYGIQNELLNAGYLPIQLLTDWNDRLSILRHLVDYRVAGTIMVDPRRGLEAEELREFQTGNIPCVYIEPPASVVMDDWVNTDDYTGGMTAAEHLRKFGHEKFAVIAPRNEFSERVRGFSDRLAKENFGVVFLDSAEALRPLLEAGNYPTALFCYSDSLALAIYSEVYRAGLSVPRDISVIGYADLDFAKNILPPLTTVRQDGRAVGKRAAQIMLQRIKDRNLPPVHEYLPVSLIERGSVGPVRDD